MDLVTILNTIRDNASADYQQRIPVATQTNIESLRFAMCSDENVAVANEFMRTLLNKIVKSVVHTKMFSNPLKTLKQGDKPLGDTVEEIYTNFIKGDIYDPTGVNLLERNLPDTKAIYHRMNRQSKYKVTVGDAQLGKAFMSYGALKSYINSIIQTLYNSAELDEFVLMKDLIKSAINDNAVVKYDVSDPLASEANAKDFIKAVKTVSGLMAFPSTAHNAYLNVQDEDELAITTMSRKDEQVLILPTGIDTSLAIDVLASTFNMSVAEFNDTRKIIIDEFPKTKDGKAIYGALVDEKFFQIYDDKFTVRDFVNGEGLYTNYILHVWQTVAYSVLVNAVVFVEKTA